MLKIQCVKCGATLKGQEVIITPIKAYIGGVKYQDFNVICSKCGGVVVHERYAKMAAENKAKAMAKVARKKGKTVRQISEEEQYSIIMRKTSKRAKEMAKAEARPLRLRHINRAINELPPEEKTIVLSQEDKDDMRLLKSGCGKPTAHIKPNSILLLTQSVIELAIAENDEDFFKSEYGAQVVDTYNLALAEHKGHNYDITAELLLEKMRKGAIRVKGENNDG